MSLSRLNGTNPFVLGSDRDFDPYRVNNVNHWRHFAHASSIKSLLERQTPPTRHISKRVPMSEYPLTRQTQAARSTPLLVPSMSFPLLSPTRQSVGRSPVHSLVATMPSARMEEVCRLAESYTAATTS